MLNPRLEALARAWLPHFLLARLDPVREIIESEVADAAASLKAGGVALDAGAGEARHRRCFVRGRYVAVDSRTGDPKWDYSRIDVQGDLLNLPLKTGSVDCVISMVVLEHVRDPGRALAEFSRVLKTGGSLYLVVPFLWEQHQAPHDYLRFTQHGIRMLLQGLPLRVRVLEPMGGFFGVCARRCVDFLGFFQRGWRWLVFVLLAPVFGLLLPLVLFYADRLDSRKDYSLGFRVRATKEGV